MTRVNRADAIVSCVIDKRMPPCRAGGLFCRVGRVRRTGKRCSLLTKLPSAPARVRLPHTQIEEVAAQVPWMTSPGNHEVFAACVCVRVLTCLGMRVRPTASVSRPLPRRWPRASRG